MHGQAPHEVDGVVIGADFGLGAFDGHGQFADGAAFPAQDQLGVGVGYIAVQGDVDFVEQGVQQLLTVAVGGGGCGPDLVQIVAEGQDRVAFGVSQFGRPGGFPAGQFGFGVGQIA